MKRLALTVVLGTCLPSVAAADTGAVAVMDIQGTGIQTDLLPTLSEILSVEISNLRRFKVIAGRDIQSMLGFERQKDVLGCTDAACLAEIGGALGVERMVASHIGKVGSTFVVNIKLINIRRAETEGRVYETVRGEVDALINTIRESVQKLFGSSTEKKAVAKAKPKEKTTHTHKPKTSTESPSREVATAPASDTPKVTKKSSGGIGTGPIVLWAIGAGGIVVGTIAGVIAKNKEECANNRMEPGAQACIAPAESAAGASTAGFVIGVAAAGGGVLWWLLSGDDSPKTAFAPVVGPNTLGVVWSGQF